MNLQSLLAAGAFISGDYVRKNVKWTHTNGKHEEVITDFDVFVKRHQSAADFEFIYRPRDDQSSIMVRRVARLIRLGEEGEEAISYDTADQFQTGLLLALVGAINEVEEENAPKKKPQQGEAPAEGTDETKN